MPTKEKKALKYSFLLLIAVLLAGIIITLPFLIHSMLNNNYVKQELSQIILEKTGIKIDPGRIYFKIFPKPYLKIENVKITLKQDNHKKKKQIPHAVLIIKTALFYPDLTTLLHARGKIISGTLILKKARIYDLTDAGISIAENIKAGSVKYLKIAFIHKRKGEFHADITGEHPRLFLKNTKIRTFSEKIFTAHMDISKVKTQISLDMFKLDYPSMSISINFLHNKTSKKSSLEISGKNVNIDEIRQISPVLFKGNKISRGIFKIIRSGKADNIIVYFHGSDLKTLFHVNNMIIKGRIEHGSIGIPKTGLITTDTTGNALVEKGILYTDIKKGRIRNSIFEKANLDVNIMDHKHPFKGIFPIDANLNDLSKILKKLLPKSLLEHELNLCKNIKGRAKGTLILDKKNSAHLSVSVSAHDIILETIYQRIPGKISITGGNFTYKDESSISVDNLSGHIGKNQFSDLCASIGLKKNHFLEIKSGKAAFAMEDVFPWLISFKKINSALFPLKSASGTININSINLKGPVLSYGQWQYQIDGSCRDINIGADPSNYGITSVSSDFRISQKAVLFSDLHADILNKDLLLSEFSRLSLKKVSIDHTKGHKSLSLTKTSFLNDIAFPLSISQAQFLLTKEAAAFKGKILFKTGPELFLTMDSETDNQTLKKLYGFKIKITIKDKNISNAIVSYIKNKSSTTLDIKGRLETKTIEKILRKGSGSAEKLFSLTNGENFIINFSKKSGAIVSTDTIDLNALSRVIKIEKLGKNHIDSILIPKSFGIKANKLIFKKIKFTPFEAKVAIDKTNWSILIQNTKLCDINITGIINKKNKADQLNLSAVFYTKNGDLAKSLPCMFGKTGLIKGNYSISGNLKSQGNMDTLFHNLNGKISFHSSDGRIYKLTLLSRILSVINISKFIQGRLPDIIQHGFAYNSIDIKADVKKDRLFLKSAVIKGVDMTLTFNGWIDMLKDKMKITCLVAPFRTADMVIKYIPVLGRILNGQLVSIPVKVTGRLNNPDVLLLPASEVGKGLINIMRRTLEAPFRLLKLVQ